jgi:cytoskeletal protein RodZ
MEDVGTRLRAARDRWKLTLDDVALRTRIPLAVLTHIEDNAFDRLPAAVFTKGHLRAYATAVQLDPEEIVSEYLEQWPEATHEPPIFRAPAVGAHDDARRIGTAIVGIAALVFAYSVLRQPGERTATATVPQPAAVVAVPVATGGLAADSLPAVATVDAGIRLHLEPTAECWVSAVADGELVIHRLLLKGERATIGAASELVLRIGDPGAFAYTLNGLRGRPLGNAGEPITVTITEQNYRTFLEETEPTPPLSEATAV